MIRIKNLTKEYGSRCGIFDLSFEIQDGETFALLGPKGSGKTTLIGILAGFLSQDQGNCSINGKNPGANQEALVRFTGCLPERIALPEDMTALGYLRYTGRLRGLKNLERGREVMEFFEIEPDIRIRRLREGQKRMLALAAVLAPGPAVLLLDEPDQRLDTLLLSRLDALLLEEKARGTTMLIVSENYTDMERVADRIGLLKRGNLAAIDDAASIRISRKKTYLAAFQSELEALRFMKDNPGMKQLGPNQLLIETRGEILPLIQLLGQYQVTGFEMMPRSLEDIFRDLYREGI